MQTTHLTRRQSWTQTKKELGLRQKEVFDLLKLNPDQGLTAWELAQMTGRMIHALRPRLTELKSIGFIETKGVRYHKETDRNEAVWFASPQFNFEEDGQGIFI